MKAEYVSPDENEKVTTKYDILDAHADGIHDELRNLCHSAKMLEGKISENDKKHELEMISDYFAHIINRMTLITERFPEFYLAMDSQPALNELGTKVKGASSKGDGDNDLDDEFGKGLKEKDN